MRLVAMLTAASAMALAGTGCKDSGGGTGDADASTGADTGLTSSGADEAGVGDGTSGADGSGDTGADGTTGDDGTMGDDGTTSDTGDDDTTTSGGDGPLLDVLPPDDDTGSSETTGGMVDFNCDNIEMFDATSIGCEFWSTNWRADVGYGMGIGIGNPSNEVATVTIERTSGGVATVLTTEMLNPTESRIININGPGGLLPSTNINVSVGLNTEAAFKVTSDVPITAMQVAPLGGGPSHVSEASLLLPRNALAESYFAVGYADISTNNGRIAVVATEDNTEINTTSGTATLNTNDVMVYSATDPTSFFVGADKPVAVFSGTQCTFVPEGVLACDHIEEQVVPAASWGTTYVGGRHPVRTTASSTDPELVYWRIIAGVDNTTVTLTPPVAGPFTLNTAGDFVEFTTAESFLAEGDQPFMLTQYMSSCRNVTPVPVDSTSPCNEPATGDPFMIQMPPVDQWLDTLPFLTDTSYPRDFVVFMREVGTTITLDCLGVVDASHFQPVLGTNYEVGAVDLDAPGGGEGSCVDGAQFVTADAPIGVIVGGMDWATSYGYAGGLAFADLWTPPTIPPQ